MTQTAATCLLTGFLAFFSAWIYRSRRNQLQTQEELLAKIHPHALSEISAYLDGLSFDDDERFWRQSGKVKGMLSRRENAVTLIRLCQTLAQQNSFSAQELEYLNVRLLGIRCATLLRLPENVLRKFSPQFPHVCARIAAGHYDDLQARVRTILVTYAPETLYKLDAVL